MAKSCKDKFPALSLRFATKQPSCQSQAQPMLSRVAMGKWVLANLRSPPASRSRQLAAAMGPPPAQIQQAQRKALALGLHRSRRPRRKNIGQQWSRNPSLRRRWGTILKLQLIAGSAG